MTPTEYKTIRKQLGLTQTELAALLGETRDTVSRRERSSKPIHGSAEYALLWLMEHGDLNNQKTESKPEAGLPLGAEPCSVVVRVVGYTDREGMLWDMVCHNETLGTITVDPWVGCALEQMTDDEKRALIGREFIMRGFWQHESGVWLCHVFSPNSAIPCHSSDSAKTPKQPE